MFSDVEEENFGNFGKLSVYMVTLLYPFSFRMRAVMHPIIPDPRIAIGVDLIEGLVGGGPSKSWISLYAVP